MGGDCLNTGCVPSKALIAAAKRARAIARRRAFGIAAATRPTSTSREVHRSCARRHRGDRAERFQGALHRPRRPGDRRRRALQGQATRCWSATAPRSRRAASSSRPARRRRFRRSRGSTASPYLTNETIFDLTARPEHLIVIGAGPIGLELAQAFRRLGAAVTVLEAAQPLAHEDAECAGVVLDALAREGVRSSQRRRRSRASRAADAKVEVVVRDGDGERDDRRQPSPGRDRPARQCRRPRPRGGRHQARRARHRGRQAAARPATGASTPSAMSRAGGNSPISPTIMPASSSGTRCSACRVKVERRHHPAGDLHRSRARPCRPDRGRGERARPQAIRVLRWPYHENDRAQAERETAGAHQGRDRRARAGFSAPPSSAPLPAS